MIIVIKMKSISLQSWGILEYHIVMDWENLTNVAFQYIWEIRVIVIILENVLFTYNTGNSGEVTNDGMGYVLNIAYICSGENWELGRRAWDLFTSIFCQLFISLHTKNED